SSSVHLLLLSFPTRRSSDLLALAFPATYPYRYRPCPSSFPRRRRRWRNNVPAFALSRSVTSVTAISILICSSRLAWTEQCSLPRSEEHTSELQSRFDLVCRL